MGAGQPVSVVIRTHDSEATVEAAVASVRAQTVPTRVVVVDSGSQDRTLSIVRSIADEVVHLAPAEFSYGRSLNRGVAASDSDVVFALSSHVVAPGPEWVARSLAHHADPLVVAVCGAAQDAAGAPLDAVVRQDVALARREPLWGLTNTAASWRADVVRAHPFDETLEACEDKEWALRVLAATSGVIVLDPQLTVDSSHRTRQGLGRYFDRVRREQRVLLRIGAMPARTPATVLRAWWAGSRHPEAGRRGFTSVTRALDHLAELLAQREVARGDTRTAGGGSNAGPPPARAQ